MKIAAPFLALLVSVAIAAPSAAQDNAGGRSNLLTNPSFADGQAGWETLGKGVVGIDAAEKREGKPALRIENGVGGDTRLNQTVAVKPQTRYRLSGYIKTRNVVAKGGGASLSLEGGFEHTEAMDGSRSWRKVDFEFESGGASSIKVGPRLGHYHTKAMGVAWFADLSLIELGPSRKR